MGNVLIIDDEPAIGDYLARLIIRMGHQTTTAVTAITALDKIDKATFNLIIADICLPDSPNPRDWITALTQKSKGIPIVLITGAPSEEINTYATEHGVSFFLSKPFELAFIRDIIEKVFPKNQ